MQVKVGLRIIISVILMLAYVNCQAQFGERFCGVVLNSGSNARVKEAKIINKATRHLALTDSLGEFSLPTSAGDTLLISSAGYSEQAVVVSTLKYMRVYLYPVNELSEVKIKGQSVKVAMKELENSYKDKGIYFKGKPPVYLLSPIDGKPLTYFYELFSKDGKRARRFQRFKKSQIDYSDVASRFNNAVIQTVIPGISSKELEDFKISYWPKSELIKDWSDFELYAYIKKSFEQFKEVKLR
jgi:hypothetical protein